MMVLPLLTLMVSTTSLALAMKTPPYDILPTSMRHHNIGVLSKHALVPFTAWALLSPAMTFASTTDASIREYLVMVDGVKKPLKELLGSKATLIVNVASQCALTPQYEELVDLYKTYSPKGFQILAFPCNQFGNQEPAEVKQVRKDMFARFGATFPILDKIDVNGPFEDPLYTKLKSFKDIGVSNIARISWNFEKFLINSDGIPVRRYKPGVLPSNIAGDIDSLITTGKIPERRRPSLNDF